MLTFFNSAINRSLAAISFPFIVGCASLANDETVDRATAVASGPTQASQTITGHLRSASFVTLHLDASVDFYTNYLGYRILGRSTIDAPKSRQVVGGAMTSGPIRYVSLAPARWSPENVEPAGISFIEIIDAEASPFDQNAVRPSRAGELVLAHRVTGIDQIAARMIAAGVPVITPLGLSGSGKSRSMAVLDPNGIRVEMYEY